MSKESPKSFSDIMLEIAIFQDSSQATTEKKK